MNTSKKIEFSKSTLLSLKAELLRKQEEVSKAKLDPRNKSEDFKPSSSKSINKTEKKKKLPKHREPIDPEVTEALRKSRDVLEKKAVLYESLSKGVDSPNADQYLVEFHKKISDKRIEPDSASHKNIGVVFEEHLAEEEKSIAKVDEDDEWIEYVDCLGRTRKCHKSDLGAMKEKEKWLQESLLPTKAIGAHLERPNPPKVFVKEGEKIESSDCELQSPDAYKDMLRQKWEEKERELLVKDSVHYQDVLFDESRAHGVSYLAFSTEQATRARQQAALREGRAETTRAQRDAHERRAHRDLLMRERVRAARARQRARAGLPPEEEAPQPSVTDLLLDFVDEQRKASDERDKETERLKREENEKQRQKERENFVREWDLGKEGTEGAAFKEMTQEQWVEMQRGKRDDEFAPFETLEGSRRNARTFDPKGSDSSRDAKPLTWSDVRPKAKEREENLIDFPREPEEQRGLFFSSTTRFKSLIKGSLKQERVETSPTIPTPKPIINELTDDDDDSDESSKHNEKYKFVKKIQDSGVEIEPPPTYDYYGPTTSKLQKYKKLSLEKTDESIEKGLSHLRHKAGKKHASNRDFSEFNM